jgi:predicted nucleic acid-binding protein
MAVSYLADMSVVTRLAVAAVRKAVRELARSRVVAHCSITDLELGLSARNAAEWDQTQHAATSVTAEEVVAYDFHRAKQVQRMLAAAGLRDRKIPDLLIAAVTEPQRTSQMTCNTGAFTAGSALIVHDFVPSTTEPVNRTSMPSGTKRVAVPRVAVTTSRTQQCSARRGAWAYSSSSRLPRSAPRARPHAACPARDIGYRVLMSGTLLELDEGRRVSLGKLGRHGRYLAHEESDGTIVLTPAAVMSEAQARLLARPDVMADIDEFLAEPESQGARRSRPRRRS